MRKIWITLFATLFFNLLNAQGFWTPIDETEVPKDLVDKFHGQHPNARNAHWGLRKSGKTELYKVTAVEDGHHVKARYDEHGTELEKIHTTQVDKVPDPVKKVIDEQTKQGWELVRIYHAFNHNKKDKDEDKENDDDDDMYKLFFDNPNHPRKHLHLEVNVNGKIKEKDYKKHSKHEVHD